jgi:hypothetical protein
VYPTSGRGNVPANSSDTSLWNRTMSQDANNQITGETDIGSVVELSDHSSELGGGVECLRVRNVSEDPQHTSCITGVCSTSDVGPVRLARMRAMKTLMGHMRRQSPQTRKKAPEYPWKTLDEGE